MQTLYAPLFLALGLACSACDFNPMGPLTDDQVTRYIEAYRHVRALAPNIGPPGTTPPDLKTLKLSVDKFDAAVKEAGLANYAEFVVLSAKVGTAMGLVQAKEFGSDVKEKVDATAAHLDAALSDPLVPESTKNDLRAKLAKTHEGVESGERWAARLMDFIDGLVSDASQETVRRHRKELQAAFR